MRKSVNISPKEIVLISDSQLHLDTFNKLCNSGEFVICEIVNELTQIEDVISRNKFDLIIAASHLKGKDVIEFFHFNHNVLNQNIPFVVLFSSEPQKEKLKFLENLNVNILFDEYLSIPLLNYALNNAVKKQKTTQLLRENEFRYKSLYDHTLDVNIINNNEEEIIDTNVQGRKQLKFKNSFPLINIFSSKRDYQNFMDILQEVEEVSRFETKIKLKKNKATCLIDAFMLYNAAQEKSGAHLVIRNVEVARRTEKLEFDANKLMVTGKFLRSLAHEIRNPLTNINLALEELAQYTEENQDAKMFAAVLKRSSNRITDLIDEIMNAYKTSEINLVSNSFGKIIENALRFANDRILLKQIKLDLNILVKRDTILADNLKLTTAILNLIVNACEAIVGENGLISISLKRKENFLVLTIKDNGCGMNEDQTKALFDPFYTAKAKGLGLGLTTTQNLIIAHNGTISVKSKMDKGTSFSISIPRKL